MSNVPRRKVYIIQSLRRSVAKATLNAVMDNSFNVICWTERSQAEAYARTHGLVLSAVVEKDFALLSSELGLYSTRHKVNVGIRVVEGEEFP